MNANPKLPELQARGHYYVAEFDGVEHLLAVAGAMGIHRASANRGDEFASLRSWWTNHVALSDLRQWMMNPPARLLGAVARVRDMIVERVDSPTKPRRKLRRNREDGDELDPQAVLERRADGWSEVERVEKPKHVVRVAANVVVSHDCTPEHLLWRGAAVAALTDILTAGGHSVEVTLFDAAHQEHDGHPLVVQECVVKHASAPLDIATLSIALAEIGFYRTAMIACRHRTAERRLRKGTASPAVLPLSERSRFDVVVDSNVLNLESAVAAVLATLGKIHDMEAAA